MTLTDIAASPLDRVVDHELGERLERIDELRRSDTIDAQTVFGMLFFHGIESGVKVGCLQPGARAAYDAVKETLRARTLTRGHAYAHSLLPGSDFPVLDECAWSDRGLSVSPASKAGFVALLEASARRAGEAAGLAPEVGVPQTLLDFVRMKVAVTRGAEPGSKKLVQLGGYPDSAHFFSFAELSLRQLGDDPGSAFWLDLARGAVAAQPVYLAVQFLKGRRAPRTIGDYGAADLLGHPAELQRRLARAPQPEDLRSAGIDELARLAGRNAHRGFLG